MSVGNAQFVAMFSPGLYIYMIYIYDQMIILSIYIFLKLYNNILCEILFLVQILLKFVFWLFLCLLPSVGVTKVLVAPTPPQLPQLPLPCLFPLPLPCTLLFLISVPLPFPQFLTINMVAVSWVTHDEWGCLGLENGLWMSSQLRCRVMTDDVLTWPCPCPLLPLHVPRPYNPGVS